MVAAAAVAELSPTPTPLRTACVARVPVILEQNAYSIVRVLVILEQNACSIVRVLVVLEQNAVA